MIRRNIEAFGLKVIDDYNKMLFISGPRQCGKTTFANMLAEKYHQGSYINWDIISDQKRILKSPYF